MGIKLRAIPLLFIFIPITLFLFLCSALGYCFLWLGSVLSDIGSIATPPSMKRVMVWMKKD